MEDIVGANLQKGGDQVATAQALGDADVVGIYFGAHWAPPCRLFTGNLNDQY